MSVAGSALELSPGEFGEFRDLVYRTSGITLGEGKESLVSARLGKRMRALGLTGFRDYLDHLRGGNGQDEMILMLDAISTNVTSFFREPEHFAFVEEQVAGWLKKGQSRFRFWSAASSSGEEPYSLAMTLAGCGFPSGADARILATDISTRILEAARAGVYAGSRLEGLPAGHVQRHFRPVRGSSPAAFSVSEDLKRLVLFRRLNLSDPPFPMRGPMDVILVRNVMIYFDNAVRRRLLGECHRLLKPGGYLLVGHAESLTGVAGEFKCIRPSIYVKK